MQPTDDCKGRGPACAGQQVGGPRLPMPSATERCTLTAPASSQHLHCAPDLSAPSQVSAAVSALLGSRPPRPQPPLPGGLLGAGVSPASVGGVGGVGVGPGASSGAAAGGTTVVARVAGASAALGRGVGAARRQLGRSKLLAQVRSCSLAQEETVLVGRSGRRWAGPAPLS